MFTILNENVCKSLSLLNGIVQNKGFIDLQNYSSSMKRFVEAKIKKFQN